MNEKDNFNNEKNINSTENLEGNVAFSENSDEQVDIHGETSENKSKKKMIAIIIGIILIMLVGLGFAFSKKQPTELTEDDYIQKCEAMIIVEVMDENAEQPTSNIDWLSYIEVEKTLVKEVTVDYSKVDLTKAGTYEVIYHIDVLDDKAEDFDKIVKVKVVAKEDLAQAEEEKKEEEAKQEVEKVEKEEAKNNTSSSNNGSTTTKTPTKPANGGSSNSGSNGSSNNGNGGNSGSNTPPSPTHTHDWQPVTKTIHHDEEGHYETIIIEEEWYEFEYDTIHYAVCNNCGFKTTSGNDIWDHLESSGHGGWHSETEDVLINTITHPAVTEQKWVVDKAAWDETVTTGYKCSCGATK